MNNNETLQKMKELRLFGMYQWLENAAQTGAIHDVNNNELLAHLIEAEYDDRFDRRLQRLIKNAGFRFICQLEDIKYTAERNLTKKQILKISDLNWLKHGENIIMTGSTGTGKTFLACAIGMKACMQGYRVQFFPANKLFYQLKYAKSCGNYLRTFEKIIKNDLLIIDDFGLEILDKESRISFFEILEEITGKKSLIISSQIPAGNWFDIIGEKTIADAICDRIIANSQFFDLQGDSLRQIFNKKS
jgi:DNA replication protein DnaC